MSWSRSSKLGLAVVLVLVLVAAVGVASAVSVTNEEAPEEAAAGDEVTVTVEMQDLYAEESTWDVNGRTELENAQWTIELYQGDQIVDTFESTGEQPEPVTVDESQSNAPDRVVVTISGTAPTVDEYSYDEPASFLGGEVVQVVGGGSDVNYLSEQRIHHFTSESQSARTALDDASAAIESARDDGADVSDAESTFDDAVAAYDDGNFAEATSLAEDAQSQAESAGGGSDGSTTDDGSDTDGSQTDDSSDGSDGGSADGGDANDGSDDGNSSSSGGSDDDGGILSILLYVVLGLVILGAVGGGLYWYQQQNKGPSRDPLG